MIALENENGACRNSMPWAAKDPSSHRKRGTDYRAAGEELLREIRPSAPEMLIDRKSQRQEQLFPRDCSPPCGKTRNHLTTRVHSSRSSRRSLRSYSSGD
jgi:hypothetical protein